MSARIAPPSRIRLRAAPGLAARAAVLVAVAAGIGACGGGSRGAASDSGPGPASTTRVEVVSPARGGAGFNAAAIYRREAPGVVTVRSVFTRAGGLLPGRGGQESLGSGFVISAGGEIATNAHVVTDGTGASIHSAGQVYVDFADGNQVPARIIGFDPNSDVALLHIRPAGLTLRPLPLGASSHIVVGSPVAAIGSPFGEAQSLSVGVISAVGRSIDSLTGFSIPGAIQTDAAINHGNSGGPLVDGAGRVLGINSQIESSSGGGSGVGFAVPVDAVKRSLGKLRESGKVRYAYLGVSTVGVFPQLAGRFGLPVTRGAYVQTVSHGGPAAGAGIRAGDRTVSFQARPYRIGGDIITAVNGQPVRQDFQLGEQIAHFSPGQQVSLEVWRGKSKRTIRVKLGERPGNTKPKPLP